MAVLNQASPYKFANLGLLLWLGLRFQCPLSCQSRSVVERDACPENGEEEGRLGGGGPGDVGGGG